MPHVAAAIEAQIDCDDAGDDFVKEKLHSNIHSSSTEFDDLAVAAEVLRVRFGSRAAFRVADPILELSPEAGKKPALVDHSGATGAGHRSIPLVQ